ncbi:hypothetical protein [Tateyamaria omphalii]|uniref:Uncharacterized protein n=1 Tax=Tateyamaria omphalii TaxID=299262 RepID=A0A1P8MTG6_9RHOB|nr:hypothetical protein [Tateyamaria omphalii]APX11334.1 hypothetical protein BWR18_06305 [Tateyamaria omphalii]
MMRKTLIFLLMASPALADVTSPSGKTVECYCTDKTGSRIELGQTICMQVDGRMFMAQCQMSLNSPMWRQVEEGCLSSSLSGGDQQPLKSLAVDAQI